MIRLTERTFELTLNNDFLILRLDHVSVDTLSASSVAAAKQKDRFTILEIKKKFALTAHEIRSNRGLHLYFILFNRLRS